jgi:hypothetical protein
MLFTSWGVGVGFGYDDHCHDNGKVVNGNNISETATPHRVCFANRPLPQGARERHDNDTTTTTTKRKKAFKYPKTCEASSTPSDFVLTVKGELRRFAWDCG